jgi:hypothetical protein
MTATRTPEQQELRNTRARELRAARYRARRAVENQGWVRRRLRLRYPEYAARLEHAILAVIMTTPRPDTQDDAIRRAERWARAFREHRHPFRYGPGGSLWCGDCGTRWDSFWHRGAA